MADQAALRRAMLLEVYHRSRGNPNVLVDLKALADRLGIRVNDARVTASQISGMQWAVFDQTPAGGFLRITMSGVEASEKLETPFLKRLPGDHPILFAFLVTCLTVVLSKLLDLWFKGGR
jgi:hypothetical protein